MSSSESLEAERVAQSVLKFGFLKLTAFAFELLIWAYMEC